MKSASRLESDTSLLTLGIGLFALVLVPEQQANHNPTHNPVLTRGHERMEGTELSTPSPRSRLQLLVLSRSKLRCIGLDHIQLLPGCPQNVLMQTCSCSEALPA